MVYDIRVVEDTALPADQGWLLLAYDGRVTFVVKESAAGPETMADGWAAYRRLARRHLIEGRGRRLQVVV